MNSAPARHKIGPQDAFAFDNFRQFPQTGPTFTNDAQLVEPDEEATPVSMLYFDRKLFGETEGPLTSSFFGLSVGDDGETTMVIPDGPCDVDSVTSASCETFARSLGWHVERREVGRIIRG